MVYFENASQVFEAMPDAFRPDRAEGARATIQFELAGDGGGQYWVAVADGRCQVGAGAAPLTADAVVRASARDWIRISNGELNPILASLQGKVKIAGASALALKLAHWFPRTD